MTTSASHPRQTGCNDAAPTTITREQDSLVSWCVLKIIVAVVFAVVGVMATVLAAYYTAEGSQNDRIAEQRRDIVGVQTRVEVNEKGLSHTLQRFEVVLSEQRKILDETKNAITRIDTCQQLLSKEVEKISTKLDNYKP